jgi:hypothetical protein
MNVMPKDIVDDVKTVLLRCPVFISAYQILEELPSALRDRLIAERGWPGEGSGNYYAAASVVSDAAETIKGVEIVFARTKNLKFEVAGQDRRSSSPSCGLYRLNPNSHG